MFGLSLKYMVKQLINNPHFLSFVLFERYCNIAQISHKIAQKFFCCIGLMKKTRNHEVSYATFRSLKLHLARPPSESLVNHRKTTCAANRAHKRATFNQRETCFSSLLQARCCFSFFFLTNRKEDFVPHRDKGLLHSIVAS